MSYKIDHLQCFQTSVQLSLFVDKTGLFRQTIIIGILMSSLREKLLNAATENYQVGRSKNLKF